MTVQDGKEMHRCVALLSGTATTRAYGTWQADADVLSRIDLLSLLARVCDPREEILLCLRYGLGAPPERSQRGLHANARRLPRLGKAHFVRAHTLGESAFLLRLGVERLRQVESFAVRKLRCALRSQRLSRVLVRCEPNAIRRIDEAVQKRLDWASGEGA